MKILIVDDNADDRRLLRYNCEMHGHSDLILARDGQEGLDMARIHKPDLIISDALMPNMDGFHFLRELKKDNTVSSIPFVFYSATYIGSKEAELAASLGAEAFIVKPLEPEEFWKRLKVIIDRSDQIKAKAASSELVGEEKEYLSRYSHIVATKLEEKMRELENAKKDLERSEVFVKKILESVDEGLIVVDSEYRIISANQAYCRQNNISNEEILGKHCFEVSHHQTAPCYMKGENCSVKNTFETGLPCEVLHIHNDDNKKAVYVETKTYPMKDPDGKVVSVIEIVNDVTEKRKLEEQLRQSQKMEAIGIFSGGMAHDFNNILTAIIGYANLMDMKIEADTPLKSDLQHILKAAERATALTRSLLAFSRKQPIHLAPLNLNELIMSVEKFLKRIIGEDLELRTNLAARDICVNADSGQIEQVLMNLATNARDAMPGGGLLTISTSLEELDAAYTKSQGYGSPGLYSCITVSDSGTGMDEDTKNKIFEPFFTTKESGRGTGLGLSIAYGIIKQHDGYISLSSKPGEGTTFRIYLPLAEGRCEGTEAVSTSIPARGSETILIAEDDVQVRTLLKTLMMESGYSVIEAVNGEDAVNKFNENAAGIRLLVLDAIMPVKSGNEAYDMIKAVKPGIKALFLSGHTVDFLDKKGLIKNGINFLPKPVFPNEFLKKIRELLDANK